MQEIDLNILKTLKVAVLLFGYALLCTSMFYISEPTLIFAQPLSFCWSVGLSFYSIKVYTKESVKRKKIIINGSIFMTVALIFLIIIFGKASFNLDGVIGIIVKVVILLLALYPVVCSWLDYEQNETTREIDARTMVQKDKQKQRKEAPSKQKANNTEHLKKKIAQEEKGKSRKRRGVRT